MMHYLELESEDTYQYIVLRNLESEVDLNLREIFAFVQAEYQPITTTVTIPETVTNVGTNELITVEFSNDVDISSFILY